jgi:DNA helicase-2/ATP-dependent DNA helicase PcrA
MYDTPQEESIVLVNEIQILLRDGYKPQDIFVASRTRAQLGYLEGGLVKAKIPFINIAGGSFWNSKHVQDVIAYVKLAYDNSDNEAFARVYDTGSNENVYTYSDKRGRFNKGDYSAKRWLGKQFLSACDGQYKNIYQALKSRNGWRWRNGVEDLVNMLDLINLALAEDGLSLALETVIDNCYKDYLIAIDEIDEGADSSKLDDLNTVVDMARTFDDCESFFSYVDECVRSAEDAKNGDWSEYVILSTAHRLKGLERKVIFGIGLCEGYDENNEPCGLLPHTYSMKYPPQFGVLPGSGMGRIEDERCLAFVLVSRGQERVILSGVRSYQKMVNLQPSRFVMEMMKDG